MMLLPMCTPSLIDRSRWFSCASLNSTMRCCMAMAALDRKSTRLNSSHTVIYTLSLHDALPIYDAAAHVHAELDRQVAVVLVRLVELDDAVLHGDGGLRSEEHTSELQSHSDLHSFPTRRSSDL